MGKRILENIELIFEEAKILERVFENSPNPKVIMDENMEIYTANKSARELFSIESLEKQRKRNLKKYLDKDAIKNVNVIMNQVKHGNEEDVMSFPLQLAVNASIKHFEVVVHPYISGRWHFWIFNDVTSKVFEQETRNQFIAVAGHEIRTPLAVVIAYTELLKRKYKGDKVAQKYISKIEDKSEVLRKYIDSIVDEIKIGAGKLLYDDKEVEISTVISDSIDEIRKTAPGRTIIFRDNTKNAIVFVDPIRISQVVHNLLHNAIKHSSKNKEIIVQTQITNDTVMITVKDKGKGIKIADQKKIFRAFYRSNNSGEKSSGLGLGLYISFQILKRYGSKLQVNSRKGKGATFYFDLPLVGQ